MSAVVVTSIVFDGEHRHDADTFDTNDSGELWVTRGGDPVAVYARGCWTAGKLVDGDPVDTTKGTPT